MKLSNFSQMNFFTQEEETTVSIKKAATIAGVSTATIRNWIKTGYLVSRKPSQIVFSSLEKFQTEVAGVEKLNHRANKSKKDSHNQVVVLQKYLDTIKCSQNNLGGIGERYEQSLSDSYRNKEGIYYTPESVVNRLFVIPPNDITNATFCDPCCGSGNFIMHALNLGFMPENIYAFDIDPVAIELTKKRIFEYSGYTTRKVVLKDFLEVATNSRPPKFDYIFTNPPWGKKLKEDLKEEFSYRLRSGNSKDTSSLFYFACLNCLNDNGTLGLLLPEAFFNIAVYENARLSILHQTIKLLIDFGKPFKGLVTRAQGVILQKNIRHKTYEIKCVYSDSIHTRASNSFKSNPKHIFNMHCSRKEADVVSHLFEVPHITLANNAKWGLGIVTGNNKKYVVESLREGYMPVFKGADITPSGLKPPTAFIPKDTSKYQQVAPIGLYEAEDKLIYKFISSKLCFFYDDQQRYILNSANLLIPSKQFYVPAKILGQLLSSDFMNWLFTSIFHTHKVLRGDLEALPIHSQFLNLSIPFDESKYLINLGIERSNNGTYRIKT